MLLGRHFLICLCLMACIMINCTSLQVFASIPQQGMRVVGERTLTNKGKTQEYWVIHNSDSIDNIWGVDMYGGIGDYYNLGQIRYYPWYGGIDPVVGATGAYNFNGSFFFDNDFIIAITPTVIGSWSRVRWVLTNKNSAMGMMYSSSDFQGESYDELLATGKYTIDGYQEHYGGYTFNEGYGSYYADGVIQGEFLGSAETTSFDMCTNIFPYDLLLQSWPTHNLVINNEILLLPTYNRISSMNVSGVDGVPANDVILFPIGPTNFSGTCYVQADIKLLVPKVKVPPQKMGGYFVTGSAQRVVIEKDADEQEMDSILAESGGGVGGMKNAKSAAGDAKEQINEKISGFELYGNSANSIGFYYEVLKAILTVQPWLVAGMLGLCALSILFRRGIG